MKARRRGYTPGESIAIEAMCNNTLKEALTAKVQLVQVNPLISKIH